MLIEMDKELLTSKLNRMATTCSTAIYESVMAVDDKKKGYPFAAGYSRAALKELLNDIQFLLEEVNNVG
jgi:hypothetical protein